jgi:hypothetical protein
VDEEEGLHVGNDARRKAVEGGELNGTGLQT